jgi:hypothetical protein
MALTAEQQRTLEHARQVLAQVPDNTSALRLALKDILKAFGSS